MSTYGTGPRYPQGFKRRNRGLALGCVGLLVVFAVLVGGCKAFWSATESQVEFTVESKERGSESKPTLVWATDGRVFEVSDSVWKLHFTSANVYGPLKVGRSYECLEQGFRFGLFSMFPNLIECEEATR